MLITRMGRIKALHGRPSTLAARPLVIEKMASSAVCPGLLSDVMSTLNIHSMGDWFKMLWVDTKRRATEMVKFEFVQDRAYKKKICKTVGKHMLLSLPVWGKVSVAPIVGAGRPQPTRSRIPDRPVLVDLIPEPPFSGSLLSVPARHGNLFYHSFGGFGGF